MAKTDGVPLFVEELTKAVLESGLLKDAGDHYELAGPLPPLALPSTLHDSLLARLDRLAPVKEIAQIGAALGREFSHGLLAAVAARPEAELQAALDQLVAAELVYRRGTPPDVSYSFKHALIQDAAYGTLLKSRRQQLHARIAQVLEEQFPEAAHGDPQIVAHHPHLVPASINARVNTGFGQAFRAPPDLHMLKQPTSLDGASDGQPDHRSIDAAGKRNLKYGLLWLPHFGS